MKILIVEDEAVMANIMESIVKPMVQRYPGSEVTVVGRFAQAVEIARRDHPDAIILDLSLLDSTMDQTLARLEELREHSAIVICSGHSRHLFEHLVPDDVEILEKADFENAKSMLPAIIIRAIEKWKAREFAPLNNGISRLKERLTEEQAPHGDGEQ